MKVKLGLKDLPSQPQPSMMCFSFFAHERRYQTAVLWNHLNNTEGCLLTSDNTIELQISKTYTTMFLFNLENTLLVSAIKLHR